jgi:pyrimidine-nucleoside phosphorylase
MRAVELIEKKKRGGKHTPEELDWLIGAYTRGEVPDYQMAAWLMAVWFRGMASPETAALTMAMVRSGERLDLSGVAPFVVDKHSTGGVGDKTSLAVVPLVASCGVPVAKMSGRGLGFSGGTLDKLESIPGLTVDLSKERFIEQVRRYGLVIAGQSADLAPADGKLYALRDVTATVDCIPLIASSVMSKKIAAGAHGVVLDVKVGRGAFMKDLASARTLAEEMTRIGRAAGMRTVAVLSSMEQPLGRAVGNALEVREAIETLQSHGPPDFVELCLTVGSEMLLMAGRASTVEEARSLLQQAIASGAGLAKLREMVQAQGGDPALIDDPDRLPRARLTEPVAAPQDGYLAAIDAEEIGLAAVQMGAGRAVKGQPVDHAVGLVFHAKVSSRLRRGDLICELHLNNAALTEPVRQRVLAACTWSEDPVTPPPLILGMVHDG